MFPTLFQMQPKFKAEEEAEKYLSPEKRAEYLSTINDAGQLVDRDGNLLNNAELMYVVSSELELYAVPAEAKLNHSFLLAGAPVLAAGFLLTDENARIIHLDNNSGHYCPTMKGMLFIINYLYEKSCSQSAFVVEFENHDQFPSRGIITTYDMCDLLEQVKNMENENCFEEVLDEVNVVCSAGSKTNNQCSIPEGYADCIGEAQDNAFKITSRFGRNPEGWSKRLGLFGERSIISSMSLTHDSEILDTGCVNTINEPDIQRDGSHLRQCPL